MPAVTLQDLIDARTASLRRLADSAAKPASEQAAAKQWADATRADLESALREHGPVMVRGKHGWVRYVHSDRHGYGIESVDLPPPASEVIVDADPVRPLLPLQAG